MDGFLQIVSQLALGAIALLVISGFSGLGFAFNRNNTTKIFSISNCKVQKVYRHTSKMMGGSSSRKQFVSYKRHATKAPYITREFSKNLIRSGVFLASLLASLSGSLVGAWISETRLEPRHETEGGL